MTLQMSRFLDAILFIVVGTVLALLINIVDEEKIFVYTIIGIFTVLTLFELILGIITIFCFRLGKKYDGRIVSKKARMYKLSKIVYLIGAYTPEDKKTRRVKIRVNQNTYDIAHPQSLVSIYKWGPFSAMDSYSIKSEPNNVELN